MGQRGRNGKRDGDNLQSQHDKEMCIRDRYFNVPVVFAKKAKSKNIDGEVYTSKVQSFTYGREYDITLAKKFLNSGDRVLILDDFLANGKAMKGLLRCV